MLTHSQTAEIVFAARTVPTEPSGTLGMALRSCFMAIALSLISFVATFALLNPSVVGATTRAVVEGPAIEDRAAPPPIEQPKAAPLVESTQPEPPTVRLSSEPSGAMVRDAQGRTIGTTPAQLYTGGDLVIQHDGYLEKHLSVSLRDQSVLVVLARDVPGIGNTRMIRSRSGRAARH